ncbi:Sec-independent protein translocase protein TatB [Solirhodobacter olei]|uniref:Sec-independent protein translocase protein TatB n=1 Tax=Solirhodobacter olei TaxID=2493082 RepID=UPI000FDA88CA|nr:Sec-independent protein translocase protein TatB [Solirhodobacter olei]
MFDIGWSELMLIGIAALIFVGPKDLPKMFHALGQFTAKARAMARDFQNAMEQAAREAGVDEVASDIKNLTSARSLGLDALSSASKKLDAWDQTKRAVNSGADEAKTEGEGEMGPETAALAAKVKAGSDEAEARAAEMAALRDKPTPEELAEATFEHHDIGADAAPKKARKPRAKPAAKAAAATEDAAADTAKAASKSATKTRKTPAKSARKPAAKTTAATAEAEAPAASKPRSRAKAAAKPKAAATRANGADETASATPKTPRKRAASRNTDA